MQGFMTDTNNTLMPGFWRICFADAYLFKLCCIFLPLLLIVLFYNIAAGRPLDDYTLPALFSAVLLGVVVFRWMAIAGTFKEHEAMTCRIADISPATGLFGLQVFVSFYASCAGDAAERGCFLVSFNPRVKNFHKGNMINVLWNFKNMYVIKEAYLDD
jgi:hypothetical protein